MTNEAAIGYMILAAKRVKFDPLIIAMLERNMRSAMDEYSEEEAEEAYRKN